MTEEEYESWLGQAENRGELVEYLLEVHEPVSLTHVSISEFLTCLLRIYRERRPVGRSISPTYPIRFRTGLRRVPDLMFVTTAHLGRLRSTYLDGPADVAWEIVSADSIDRDWNRKFAEYQRHGIQEYWIIDPLTQRAVVYVLGPDGYSEHPEVDGKLSSTVIEGFWIHTAWLWQDPLPDTIECLREMGVQI
jgi:Uma2 family endonuclease